MPTEIRAAVTSLDHYAPDAHTRKRVHLIPVTRRPDRETDLQRPNMGMSKPYQEVFNYIRQR